MDNDKTIFDRILPVKLALETYTLDENHQPPYWKFEYFTTAIWNSVLNGYFPISQVDQDYGYMLAHASIASNGSMLLTNERNFIYLVQKDDPTPLLTSYYPLCIMRVEMRDTTVGIFLFFKWNASELQTQVIVPGRSALSNY